MIHKSQPLIFLNILTSISWILGYIEDFKKSPLVQDNEVWLYIDLCNNARFVIQGHTNTGRCSPQTPPTSHLPSNPVNRSVQPCRYLLVIPTPPPHPQPHTLKKIKCHISGSVSWLKRDILWRIINFSVLIPPNAKLLRDVTGVVAAITRNSLFAPRDVFVTGLLVLFFSCTLFSLFSSLYLLSKKEINVRTCFSWDISPTRGF